MDASCYVTFNQLRVNMVLRGKTNLCLILTFGSHPTMLVSGNKRSIWGWTQELATCKAIALFFALFHWPVFTLVGGGHAYLVMLEATHSCHWRPVLEIIREHVVSGSNLVLLHAEHMPHQFTELFPLPRTVFDLGAMWGSKSRSHAYQACTLMLNKC